MKTFNKRYLIALIFLSLFFIGGCASLRGSAGILAEHKVTIQDLEKNWTDFTVYYAGLSEKTAAALMFDPKNDNKTLLGKAWTQVKDKKTLSEIIGWIQTYIQYDPSVYRILGPDGQLFGYVFAPRTHILMKVIDDHTLYVYDVESPLYFDGGPDFGDVHEPSSSR
jgi:hypothetical protein